MRACCPLFLLLYFVMMFCSENGWPNLMGWENRPVKLCDPDFRAFLRRPGQSNAT